MLFTIKFHLYACLSALVIVYVRIILELELITYVYITALEDVEEGIKERIFNRTKFEID